MSHLFDVIGDIQQGILRSIGHGFPASSNGLTVLLSKALTEANVLDEFVPETDEEEKPSKRNEARADQVEALFNSEAIDALTRHLLAEPGGEGNFKDRRIAVTNTMHTLLIACGESAENGDWLIRCNVLPKLEKGATKVVLYDNRQSYYGYFAEYGERPYHDTKILPFTGLAMIVVFMLDPANRRKS